MSTEKQAIAELAKRRGMERAHGEGARAMFDRIAPTYDLLNSILSLGVDARWRRRAVKRLLDAPRGELLDVCAGTLDLSAEIERAMPSRRVVAVDFSPEMLARGAFKVTRTERVVGDATALPFEDARFAGVVCGFGLRNVGDPRRAIAEALRVSKPRAPIVILEFFAPRGPVARALHAAYVGRLLPAIGGAIAGEQTAYRYLARSIEGFVARADLEAMFCEAGATEVTAEDLFGGVASIVTAKKGGG